MQIPVSFMNQGQQLFGMIHIPDGEGPWPGVVLCHGFTGTKVEANFLFVKFARKMCRQGFAVLRFDFRGSGDSEGDFEEMTVPGEVSDARAAISFLSEYPGVDPNRIGLLGYSMGGLVAACAGSSDARVQSMVLWAPSASAPERYTRRIQEAPRDDRGRIHLGAFILGPQFLPELQTLHPLEEIRKFKGPLLLIHGSQDQVVPPSDSENLYSHAGSSIKKLEFIENADHAWGSEEIMTALFSKTLEWFKQSLMNTDKTPR